MYRYIDKLTGEKVAEVESLSFLCERENGYGWLKLHFHHFRMHLAIRWADCFVVADETVAADLVRYYFVPKEKIRIRNH